MSRSPTQSLPLMVRPLTSCIYPITHASHEPILGVAQIVKLLVIQYSASSFYPFHLCPNTLLNTMFLTLSNSVVPLELSCCNLTTRHMRGLGQTSG